MNIVITGASKGIGFELAKLFAGDENNTVIAIARNEGLLKRLKNECIKQNLKTKLKPVVFDIEDIDNIKNNLYKIISAFVLSIDILINNAGYLVNKPFLETQKDDIYRTLNINYIGHAILIQELYPFIAKGSVKHVVNISSMGGVQGSFKFPGLCFYSSSKAAIANLTECLAEEFKNDGIKFNCLALGAVNTEMLQHAFPGYKAPLEANEIAEFIYDFAINGSKFMNGKIIPVSISTP